MENVFSPAVTDSAKSAGRDAQKLGQDVKSEFKDVVSRGRGIVDHLATDAKSAADKFSGRAQEALSEGREQASKAVGRVSDYAHEHTAIVTFAAFGVGVLVGALVARRS